MCSNVARSQSFNTSQGALSAGTCRSLMATDSSPISQMNPFQDSQMKKSFPIKNRKSFVCLSLSKLFFEEVFSSKTERKRVVYAASFSR